MSRWHLQQAWELCMRENLTQAERCILMAIASRLNARTGQWRIGIHAVAQEAGVGEAYAKKVITRLRRKGVLASSISGNDRACTWWLPMVATLPEGRDMSDILSTSTETLCPPEQSADVDPDVDKESTDPHDITSTNTYGLLTQELPGEIGDVPDGLSAIEIGYIAAKIERGVTKAEAVRDVLALRARRNGSREHGTSTGRANKTTPVQSIGQVFAANEVGT